MNTDQKPTMSDNNLLPHLCSGPSVVGLVLAGELIALALVLVKSSLWGFSWMQLGYLSMVVQWIMLLSALVLCQLSSVFSRFSTLLAGCLAYSVVLLIALIVISLALWLMDDYVDVWALAKNMLLAAIFSGIFLRYLYLQQQLRRQQQAELQSRIQALHARIRPHFLFNSMNAVASLIPTNPDLAEKVVEDLSQIFRVSLQEVSLVSLDEEINLCKSYVGIEQIRLGKRLQVEWHCDHQCGDTRVPSLILQPLIENAIYHGVQRLIHGGVIRISTWMDNEQLTIKVRNPTPTLKDNQTDKLDSLFDSSGESKSNGNRMALHNIEHRLSAHYGNGASITMEQIGLAVQGDEQETNIGYEVTLTIPLEKRQK